MPAESPDLRDRRPRRCEATILLLVALVAAGCATSPPRQLNPSKHTLDLLRPGTPLLEFGRIARSPGAHQFTVRAGNSRLQCLRAGFEKSYFSAYLVFRDGALVSVHDAAPFEERIGLPDKWVAGVTRHTYARWDLGPIVEEIRQSENRSLTADQLTAAISQQAIQRKRAKPSLNILPAFIVLSPVIVPAALARNAGGNARRRNWAQKYDPFKARLGMTSHESDKTLGAPQFIVPQVDGMIRVYGPPDSLHVRDELIKRKSGTHSYWIAVHIKDGKVVKILGNRFFDSDKLLKPGYRVE